MIKTPLKTIVTLSDGGTWKESYPCSPGDPYPTGATATIEFFDSTGEVIAMFSGTVDEHYVTFSELPDAVDPIPNGAAFRVRVFVGTDPYVIRFGEVFRRQNFFPPITPSPVGAARAMAASGVAAPAGRRFIDNFQRPAGWVGSRWLTLIGRPIIFAADDLPSGVGADTAQFPRMSMRYYQALLSDTVEVEFTVLNRGGGLLVCEVAASSDASSFAYAKIDTAKNTVSLGQGHGRDIADGLVDAIKPVPYTAAEGAETVFRLRLDANTFTLFGGGDEELASWPDGDAVVPHGLGYRYFAFSQEPVASGHGPLLSSMSAQDV